LKADTYTLAQIFGLQTRYLVPLYQRPYVWTQDQQWVPLWEDVRSVAERLLDDTDGNDDVPHFMGAIVVAQQGGALAQDARLIIDGQQRLTTFQIVMAAIRQVADDRDEQRARKHVEPLLLIDPDLVDDPELRYKLIPTNADRLAFRSIVTDGPRTEPKLPEGASDRTIDAFRFFVDQIGPWLDEGDDTPTNKLIALAKAVRNLVKIVVIDLEARDNAQAIFETLNARGQPLLAADLIKNDLFQRATAQRESAGHLYETYWHDFDMKHWREEVGQGRFRRPRIDIFLGYWLTMRTLDEVPTQQLFDRFRDHMRTAGMVARSNRSSGPADQRETFEGFDKLVVRHARAVVLLSLECHGGHHGVPVMLYLFGPTASRTRPTADGDRRHRELARAADVATHDHEELQPGLPGAVEAPRLVRASVVGGRHRVPDRPGRRQPGMAGRRFTPS